MDGSGVTQSSGGGGGTVNCQFYAQGNLPVPNIGNDEVFELIPVPQVSSDAYAIRSMNYSSSFLRIDGSGVTQSSGGGSGKVNCQFYASGSYPTSVNDFELLVLGQVNIGGATHYYIRSGPFQSAFLRMDGSEVTQSEGAGSGTVNCQFYAVGTAPNSVADFELFNIIPLQNYPGPW